MNKEFLDWVVYFLMLNPLGTDVAALAAQMSEYEEDVLTALVYLEADGQAKLENGTWKAT